MPEQEPIDVDAIIAESAKPEATLAAPGEGDISDALAETEAPTNEPDSTGDKTGRTINYKGKDVSLDDDRFTDYAQKGFDYDKKMHDFRVQKKVFEQEQARFKDKYNQLEEIDTYAKSNPAWLQNIQQQWALIQAGKGPQVTPETKMDILESQVNLMNERLTASAEKEEQRRIAEIESSQEGAISKYKDSHPELDWQTKDAEGNTLEDRIGLAMLEKRVPDFNIMADHFLLKQHLERKILEGKEAAGKSIQKANKMGLGRVTDKSLLGVNKTTDFRQKSYSDLATEGLRELGIEI